MWVCIWKVLNLSLDSIDIGQCFPNLLWDWFGGLLPVWVWRGSWPNSVFQWLWGPCTSTCLLYRHEVVLDCQNLGFQLFGPCGMHLSPCSCLWIQQGITERNLARGCFSVSMCWPPSYDTSSTVGGKRSRCLLFLPLFLLLLPFVCRVYDFLLPTLSLFVERFFHFVEIEEVVRSTTAITSLYSGRWLAN